MRKTDLAICAAAALGFCLMVPKGVSAFPAAADADKAYTQTVTGKSAAVPVYIRRGYWGGRVGLGRGYGWGWRRRAYWRGRVGLGRGYGWGWRRAAWRRGYYGGYGLGTGFGLGTGLGYGGSYAATSGGCCYNPCGCGGLFGGLFQ
jgi:hypothetical protein